MTTGGSARAQASTTRRSAALAARGCNEVLVEAGATLAGQALQAGLVDELVVYVAPHLMGHAARGLVELPGLARMADRLDLAYADTRRVGSDLRIRLRTVAQV